MTKLFERLLEKRGVSDAFLKPKYEECLDPFLLPEMDKAVKRIEKAIKNKEKILIYGDYDADGVTASVVMKEALVMIGANKVEIMLPNRFKDGYGMSTKVVDRAREDKVELIITVDCGSGNLDIIEELRKIGVDVIVSDHHECPEKLPKAVAVINPKRKDFEVPLELKDLAGVGVAFKIVQAMRDKGLIANGQEKWLLDLVLIGTICDNMPMTLENRRLCYFGMVVLKKTRRVGLLELMRFAGVKTINTDSIGFQIGPRINATGRIKSAELALELLLAKSAPEAVKIAEKMEALNLERKNMQNAAIREINETGVGKDPVIVVSGDWHEGVLGIIAGKLTEEYRRPSFVFTKLEDVYKGSGRSFGEFNLAQALFECQNTILAGGGHAGACGVKVPISKLNEFKTEINKYYKSLKLEDQERFLNAKEDLAIDNLSDFEPEILDEMKQLEPFGDKNEEPVFMLENVEVRELRKMGKNGEHLSLLVSDKKGNKMKTVAFYAPERWLELEEGTYINIWIKLIENDWNGIKTLEGRIEKISLAESGLI
ncbi:single-stranded-DNA-specific exonuclease RecJ [Candidatus Saccharibacteria bacterium]|nr:single-stranded-DNA-specific exonuclease RecJ [Candidatus Saccharibacteria bacterium]